MKAITVWQPWASLIAVGAKKYETRGWKTNYRGPIAIHAAAKRPDIDSLSGAAHHAIIQTIVPLVRGKAKTTMYLPLDLLPRGAIIATAELMGCWEIQDRPSLGGTVIHVIDSGVGLYAGLPYNELLFGGYTPGRYAWELANVQMLDEPIPAKGKQGLWEWTPPENSKLLEEQL